MMLKVAAVDDEIHVLERFGRIVKNEPELECCGLFETGEELLSYLQNNSLDAVFMDIEMPGVNGLSLCEKVMDVSENTDVIFVTAYNHYAIDAFEVSAIDYILKPLTNDRLAKVTSRLQKRRNKSGAGEINPLSPTVLVPIPVPASGRPRVRCFGSFELLINGEAITWKNSKAKEIFAFLVYKKGEPVSWEKIADVIWPDYDSEKAHANFHATTYLLRKRLYELRIPRIVEFKRGNYRIVREEIDCDAYEMEEKLVKHYFLSAQDMDFLESVTTNGYMEENGYEWSYSKAVEINNAAVRILKAHGKTL